MNQMELLEISDPHDLNKLHRLFFEGRSSLSEVEIKHIFKLCDALWQHSGNPLHPHAELTSGKCSDGFVDVLRVLCRTNLCEIFAQMLVRKLEDEYNYYTRHPGSINWVIGSDHAGAAISHATATLLGTKHDFTEKGPNKTQLWQRFTIEPNEVVLQVEELVTTTGTLKAVRDGINLGNKYPVHFAPVVMTLVHRSDQYDLEGDPILHLLHLNINVWEPSDCPLCKQGSPRVRPKQNWAQLTMVS